jgi:hypothetical protein
MSKSRSEIAARVSQPVMATIVRVERETEWSAPDDNRLTVRAYLDRVALELWDQAPTSATPSGYKDPWWARDAGGRWWVVATSRNTSRRRLAETVAYRVDDEVKLRLSMTKASREVGREVARGLLSRAGVPKPARWDVNARPDVRLEYLALPIDC